MTEEINYAERLDKLGSVWWKRFLNVQAPYHYNIRSLKLGRCLEIGCGIGRLQGTLEAGSVGIDNDINCVNLAKKEATLLTRPKSLMETQKNHPLCLTAYFFRMF